MRKVQPEEEQCCAYREMLRAKKNKDARSEKKPRNLTAGCCSGKRLTCDELSKVTAESSTPLVCGGKIKKKTKRIKKQDDGCPPDIDKLFPQIKPSISEREKYVNILHIMCVLEEEELIRMKEIRTIREKLKEEECIEECEEGQKEIQTDNAKNVEQTSSVAESLKTEASNEEDQEKNSVTVGGKTSEQVQENRNAAKIKTIAGKSAEIECTSICSFDSVVDLTGLHLTKKDVEQIEKDREEIRQQHQKSECRSQNAEAEE